MLEQKLSEFVQASDLNLASRQKEELARQLYEMVVHWIGTDPKRREKYLASAQKKILSKFSMRRLAVRQAPMSRSAIIAELSRTLSTPRHQTAMFFEELFKLAVKECKSGAGKFVIPGLGRAVKAHRKARMGRNPQTGETVKTKAKKVVRLRPSRAFKDAVLG